MKSNTIHLIKFVERVDVESDGLEHPIFSDLSKFLCEEDQRYIGFTDNDDVFVRLPESKIREICDIFGKYGFKFKVLDVTNYVIMGDAQRKYPEVEKLTPKIFESFRLENTTIDDVLDKINDRGMDSLDEIDRLILKKISNPS